MGRASRKRAAKRAGTYVDPHPPSEKTKSAPPPRQPFSWAAAKPFIIYGVSVLMATTLALSALPEPLRIGGAAAVYVLATAGVIVQRTLSRGWAAVRRSAGIVGLIAVGVGAAGFGLSFMKQPLALNPFLGALLGVLLAGSGRVLFPTDARPKAIT